MPPADVQWALRMLTVIYSRKMAADAADDRAHRPRQALPGFVSGVFTQLLGSRVVGERFRDQVRAFRWAWGRIGPTRVGLLG